MPPVVMDLKSADDSRDVVHHAVQALAEGKIVAFPTETTYVLAASALSESAVGTLLESTKGGRLSLAIKSSDEALDYVPDLVPIGRRLARRTWPGPVTLVAPDNHADSLVRHLAVQVQKALMGSDDMLGLRVPAHHAIHDVLRLLAGPIVVAGAPHGAQAMAITADEVVTAHRDRVGLVIDGGRCRFGQPPTVVQVAADKLVILEPGVVSEQNLRRLSSLMVLFVCTGNTCRSPMAEAIFRQMVAQKLGYEPRELEDRGIVIMSAGVAAMLGGQASAGAVEVMAGEGLDIGRHESQPVSETMVRQADLILAMTRSHRQAVLAEWPDVADRVQLVMADGTDIADPVGGTMELYKRCAAQLRTELAKWLDRLEWS